MQVDTDRSVPDIALGVIVHQAIAKAVREGCRSSEEALSRLVETAENSMLTVKDVAAGVVNGDIRIA